MRSDIMLGETSAKREFGTRTRDVGIFTALLGAVLAVFLMAAPAGAQEEPPYVGVIDTTLSRTRIESCRNTGITATATGLQPGAAATFTLYSDPVVLGTVDANGSGVASLVFDLPAGTTLGAHEIHTTGTDAEGRPGLHVIDLVVVACADGPGSPGDPTDPTGPGTNPSGPLADTGTDLNTPLRLAVGLVAIGGAVVLGARKRREATS